jgi:hypothetical protein
VRVAVEATNEEWIAASHGARVIGLRTLMTDAGTRHERPH